MAGSADDPEVSPTVLEEVLLDGRAAGFLGPGPVDSQITHALGFVSILRGRDHSGSSRARVADLGSGGGLPGLVIAVECPEVDLVLIEANGRRARFLQEAAATLRVHDRVRVIQERAEIVGRDAQFRAAFDTVTARSFGRPAVVAECAAPLLEIQGWLVVSEPPGDRAPTTARWPAVSLAQLGLAPMGATKQRFGYQVLRQRCLCPSAYPRRDGVPAKRPLF